MLLHSVSGFVFVLLISVRAQVFQLCALNLDDGSVLHTFTVPDSYQLSTDDGLTVYPMEAPYSFNPTAFLFSQRAGRKEHEKEVGHLIVFSAFLSEFVPIMDNFHWSQCLNPKLNLAVHLREEVFTLSCDGRLRGFSLTGGPPQLTFVAGNLSLPPTIARRFFPPELSIGYDLTPISNWPLLLQDPSYPLALTRLISHHHIYPTNRGINGDGHECLELNFF